jgi:predicted dehydrogenase
MNIAFAGFRHSHIYALYNMVLKNSDVEINGAWEDDKESQLTAKENYGVEFTYNTYDQLLSDKKIDIVAIGNYYGVRGRMIIKALKSGKHVITDKPLCTSLEELDEIEKLVKETGLKVH